MPDFDTTEFSPEELQQLREENEMLRRQLELQQEDDITAQLQQRKEERQKQLRVEEIRSKAETQVHAVLSGMGFSPADTTDFLHQMGGLQNFVELDENGNPRMKVAGTVVTLQEGLPMLPLVQRKLRGISENDPATKLKAEIDVLREDVERQRERCRRSPDPVMMSKLSVDRKRLQALEQQLLQLQQRDEPKSPGAGFADPALMAELEKVESALPVEEARWHQNQSDSVQFAKVARMRKRRNQILREINEQLSR